jgi:hypothetical protein
MFRVVDVDRNLGLVGDASMLELDSECAFIDALRVTGAESAMDFDCCADDVECNPFRDRSWFLIKPLLWELGVFGSPLWEGTYLWAVVLVSGEAVFWAPEVWGEVLVWKQFRKELVRGPWRIGHAPPIGRRRHRLRARQVPVNPA